jgi:hypothetical protein
MVMNLVTIARYSSIAAAIVWVLGLPMVVISVTPFSSDATYFWFGLIAALLGLAATPVALAYPGPSPASSGGVIRGLGAVACLALVLSGALLVGGSTGLLGDKAPTWIPDATGISVTGFFVWVVLASYSTRRSTSLGRWVFWLGVLSGASLVLPTVISVLMGFLAPGVIVTDASLPLAVISGLLIWFCLPAWFVAVAVRMRREGSDGRKSADAALKVDATGATSVGSR